MVNYYEILGIKPGSSSSEIKRSFRRKAKEMHPDLKVSGSRNAEAQMRDLINAYQTLSNPERRSDYDRTFSHYFSKVKFNYRDFLKSKKNDLLSQSKLIFHDLLNSQYEEAISIYEYLSKSNKYYSMQRYLGHEDYMDCLFLLAEAFEKKGQYIRACEMYKELYRLEMRRPYFRHFIEEVIERLRNITCFKMVSSLSAEQVIHYIRELIHFNFSRKDNAFFYKKIAEIYCNLGRRDLAIQYLQKGLSLDQKLPGVKKLKEKIGYTEITVP